MGYKMTMYMADDGRELVKKVPRDVSLSMMMRCIVYAITLPRKQYLKLLRENVELNNARNNIREALFGEDDMENHKLK